jgi:hypothetical protein
VCLRSSTASNSNKGTDINWPLPDGRYVWWSWFIIGAIGLNVSDYCIGGIHAGLLMSPRFRALSQDQIIVHKDRSWSKLSGWKHVARKVFMKKGGADVSWMWVVLYLLKLLSWAFALSGLTMETRDSFTAGGVANATVVGANATTFNRRRGYRVVDVAYQDWRNAKQAQIPLAAALYSPPGSSLTTNVSAPNALPSDGASEIFLAPQAEVPLVGSAWGIVYRYSCSPVYNLSDFTILNRRRNRDTDDDGFNDNPGRGTHAFYDVGDGLTISRLSPYELAANILGFAEIAFTGGFTGLLKLDSMGYTADSYQGMGDEEVLEYILWQALEFNWDQLFGLPPLKRIIPELTDQYTSPWVADQMTAVGARCTSSSVTGTATVNGLAGTFHNFQRRDPEPPVGSSGDVSGIPRFSLTAASLLIPGRIQSLSLDWEDLGEFDLYNQTAFTDVGDFTIASDQNSWQSELFAAAGVSQSSGADERWNVEYDHFVQPEDLQRALLEAYKNAALQLMFSFQGSDFNSWSSSELSLAMPWTTLVSSANGVPPLLILVCLAIWALSLAILGGLYSFRKRWEETFDTKSVYWYSVEIAEVEPAPVIRTSK